MGTQAQRRHIETIRRSAGPAPIYMEKLSAHISIEKTVSPTRHHLLWFKGILVLPNISACLDKVGTESSAEFSLVPEFPRQEESGHVTSRKEGPHDYHERQ